MRGLLLDQRNSANLTISQNAVPRGSSRSSAIDSKISDYFAKSVIDPADMTNSSALATYADVQEDFLEFVAAYGAFDRMGVDARCALYR